MNFILFISSLFFPILIGQQTLMILLPKNNLCRSASICISYGLGLGLISFYIFIAGWLNLPLTLSHLYPGLIGMSVIFFIFQMLKPEPRPQQSEPVDNSATDGLPQSNPGYKALLCLTILLAIYYCIYMIWCVNHLPVYTWDSIATSVYNSKILFYEKSLSAQKNFAHLSYPLQFPIIITWISLHLGEWNDQAIKYLFPVTFIMFTILLHHFLSLWVGKKKALWGVLMLFSSNFLIYHATISYRDILMMFYVVGSILFMFEWNRTKLIGYLILSALFIGFSTFLKLEGTAYALILGLTLLYTLYLN